MINPIAPVGTSITAVLIPEYPSCACHHLENANCAVAQKSIGEMLATSGRISAARRSYTTGGFAPTTKTPTP
jgi:hypothetical protein